MVSRVLNSGSSPGQEFFEGNIERGVFLPALPIEMPPFVREGLEPMAGHDGLELVAVLALLLAPAGIICGGFFKNIETALRESQIESEINPLQLIFTLEPRISLQPAQAR